MTHWSFFLTNDGFIRTLMEICKLNKKGILCKDLSHHE